MAKVQPLYDKAAVTQKFFELEESLMAGQHISVLSLAKASSVSWGFAKKVVEEIETWLIILIFGSDSWDPHRMQNSDSVSDSRNTGYFF